jgi:AcrR family transcriptional regulator
MKRSAAKKTAKERPLRRDAEANRQRILQAAAAVFSERGLEVTLDDVAHRAGVGVGTVYRRFPNKEALAEALFLEKLNAVADLADEAVANPDPWEALATFLERATELVSSDRGFRQIVMFAPYGKAQVDRALARLQPVVTTMLERAQQAGVVRADLDAADIPLIEFMLTTAAEYAWHVRPGVWRRYLVLVLDGLRPVRTVPTALPEPALTAAEMQQARQTPGAPLGLPARTAALAADRRGLAGTA